MQAVDHARREAVVEDDQRPAVGRHADIQTGQLGDLSMSLIKREAGIKDYSHIFLTHGGVLDRFDSTLFLAPVVYAMLFLLEKLV